MPVKKRASATSKTAKRPTRAKKSNIDKMIEAGALSAPHARKLKPTVRRKVNRLTPAETRTIIKHHLEICGVAKPNADGAFL